MNFLIFKDFSKNFLHFSEFNSIYFELNSLKKVYILLPVVAGDVARKKKAHRHVAAYGHATWHCIGIHTCVCVFVCVRACVCARAHAYDEGDKANSRCHMNLIYTSIFIIFVMWDFFFVF